MRGDTSSPQRLQRRTLELAWGRLAVWETGEGPVVLALHGLGGSGRYFGGLAPRLGGRAHLVAPDHAGFGHSDMPDVDYSRAFHLANLDAVVDRAAPAGAQVVVVGHSLGGILAALWAARTPDRVRALALVATPFPSRHTVMPGSERRLREADRRRARALVYRTVQRAWPYLTLPMRTRVFPRAVVSDYLRHSLQSYWGTAETLLWDPHTEDELAGLGRLGGKPVLLLSAADDRRIPPGCAEEWARLLPGARRVVTTGGHQLLLRSDFRDLTTWLAEVLAP